MANEFIGILEKKFEKKTGTSKNGNNWECQDFLVKTVEQYPQFIVFNCFDNTDLIEKLPIGIQIKVSFNAKAKEYQGKWYNSLQVWRIDNLSKNYTENQKIETPKEEPFKTQEEPDDLPF